MNPTALTEALARAFGFTRFRPVAAPWLVWAAQQPHNVPWGYLVRQVLGRGRSVARRSKP